MEKILTKVIIALIILMIVLVTFFFWKMTPQKQEVKQNKPKEEKVTAMPKSLQFKTGFENYKKTKEKQKTGGGIQSIDYFKIKK